MEMLSTAADPAGTSFAANDGSQRALVAELRDRLFSKALTVRTLKPLADPAIVFGGLPGVDGWHEDGPATYIVAVSDANIAAPAATRALVAAGADVLSIAEPLHSLEDVYLQLVDEDIEAASR